MKNKKIYISVAILLCAIIVSALMIGFAVNKASDIKYGEKVTAKFYDTDGNVIKKQKLRSGFAKPPDNFKPDDDMVFLRWGHDILNVNANVDIYPETIDIGETENVLYMNAVYVPKDKTFKTQLMLGGQINCSEANFSITYDGKVLELKNVSPQKECVSIENDTENSRLNIEIDSDNNLKQGGVLAEFEFMPNTDGIAYTELNMELEQIETYVGNGLSGTNCSLYDGKIYIY